MDLGQYTLEELEAFMQTEEYEQLDELSKNTLGSYVKKSKSDFALHSADFGRLLDKPGQDKEDARKMMRKRSRGIDKAVDRLTKESNDLDQYSLEELQDFMQTEDFEQLDELSKKTLGNYIKKASDSSRGHSFAAGQVSSDMSKPKSIENFEHNAKQSLKRHKGLSRATDKLTKESNESLGLLVKAINEGNSLDISRLFDKIMSEKIEDLIEYRKEQIAEELFNEEQIDELSKETLGRYIKKASRDAEHTARFASAALRTSGHEFAQNSKRRDKRQAGINDAVNKLINK